MYYSCWIQKETLNVFPDQSDMPVNQKLYLIVITYLVLLFKTIQMIKYILKCILFG